MFTNVVTLVTLAIFWGCFEAVFLTADVAGTGETTNLSHKVTKIAEKSVKVESWNDGMMEGVKSEARQIKSAARFNEI